MSQNDWQKFIRIVGLTSLAFFVLAAMYGIGFFAGNASGFYEGQAERAASQYPSDTKRIIDDCFSLPSRAATSECVSEAQATSRENQRSEYNLKTQRDMSDWAWWVMIIGALQFFATIVTLGFVKMTLDATWKAVSDTSDATNAMREANTIAAAHIRPWLVIHRVTPVEFLIEGGKANLHIECEIINTGKTPAKDAWVLATLRIGGSSWIDDICKKQISDWKADRESEEFFYAPTVTPEAAHIENCVCDAVIPEDMRTFTIEVIISVVYRADYSNAVFHTGVAKRLTTINGNPFAVKLYNAYAGQDIAISPSSSFASSS